jgi:hypothetical protein
MDLCGFTKKREERQMKLTNHEWLRTGGWMKRLSIAVCLTTAGLGIAARAQTITTTTVQGTVYLANGQPGTGTLLVSWPSFTTASGQLVAADSMSVTIASDGFVSVNLAPNMGATPAGEYYTVIYYLSDGTANTQYWVVPSAAQATLAQVQAQLMPAAQAVQAVSKAYVDQSIAELSVSQLMASGGTLTEPLYLNADPTQPLQAADKHYVDETFTLAVPLAGGTMTGPVTATKIGGLYQVDQFAGADFGAKLGACLSGLSSTNGGTCDARNFSGSQSMGSNLTISVANATVLLPCATISSANQVIVTAGTRNVSLRGCALRGTSAASGSQGGTVFLYSGTRAMVQVGDTTYAVNTMGFHLDNAAINTTAATSSMAQGLAAYRTQELDLESLYILGNSNQTGMTLDGTGNYTGGTFLNDEFSGFQTAINAIGHQVSNSATTDWMNASEFVRLHINCPTSGGIPINGTYGINLQQGDGNTFTGGDVEGCSTALHLGANAQNNTVVGLRNENSTNQVVADAGSSYNSWMTGGTMFTGQLTDNGTRNSFLDTFHRSFNGLNGDWYGSQKDATVTNHYRLGTGVGNERGLLNRYQTDYGYRWTTGFSDATAGEQFYQILDELNNVYRFSIGQYNNGQSSTNNQTVINSAGTGAVVLNGSNNSGTGGVVIGSGGASETTVATISSAGNAQFNGTLQVGGTSTLQSTLTVKNQADAEIDATLWAGLTAAQNESFIYKNYLGASQWYMENHATNDWSLTSATGGLDSFKAYQSTNSGDTYINTSNASGVVRVNYETGAGTQFKVYGGNSSSLYASFTGTTSIQFPGLAASSGHNCLQVDNSGYVTNTGSACSTGGSSGTVNSGASGQVAYYNAAGTAVSGISVVPISSGGTGSSTASAALASLGGAALTGAAFTGPVSSKSTLSVANNISIGPRYDVTNAAFGARGDGTTDDTIAIQAAFNACWNNGTAPYGGVVEFPGNHTYVISSTIDAYDSCRIQGVVGNSTVAQSPPSLQWNGSTAGAVSAITAFSVTSNVATFVAANSLTAGQWVEIGGLTSGYFLNRTISQVSSTGLSSAQFEITLPQGWSNVSTTSDSGTATTANVVVAFDSNARYEESVDNISIGSNTSFNVGFYFGSRVDTGTRLTNTWVAGSTEYSYYFAAGGINVEFDKGWRSDGAGVSGIYWRVAGQDSLGIANGTVDNNRNGTGATISGGAVMLDNAACLNTSGVHFTSRNMKVEINTSITSGLGAFTMYDCPSNSTLEAFWLDLENTWVSPASGGTAGFNFSSFAVLPANDAAVSLNILNGDFPSGVSPNTTTRWTGMPELLRSDSYGTSGWIPLLSYAPSTNSDGGYSGFRTPISLIGDVNIGQLWQDGVQASDFLFSDTGFAATPNGTTLYAGQILAPPAYWSGANGKRYAVDVVYQAGTTGTPNSGNTTCTGTVGTGVLTCTSATDLSVGQRVSIGTDTNKIISYVDATNSNAVLVNLTSHVALTYSTATALSFSAPVLGPEIQMLTKSSAAPTTLTWSQGDMEQNSAAAANGVATWVNVAAGTPGTWAGIPLGNSSGQIATSQIAPASLQGTDTKVLTAGTVTGAGSPLCTDANGGATTSGCTNGFIETNTPPWLTYLGTGADGSYEATAASCTLAAPCSLTGEKYYTSFIVDSGAYVYSSGAISGLTIHSQGACNVYGTLLVTGARNNWNQSKGIGGASSGGSGGGTAAGTVGYSSYMNSSMFGVESISGGTAGAATGGAGSNGASFSGTLQRAITNSGGGGADGLYTTGATGTQGGSTGGSGGLGGQGFVMMCASISGTGGVIDASAAYGNPPSANSTGAGSGGGGGLVILSSEAAVTTWPTIYVAGGPGGLVTVPQALATSGSCTTQPKATLGVTSGALNGNCTVVQAGVGCGTGAGITWNVVGGGGTLGTGTVNPIWSSGALASCTTTAGTSSSYSAATYITAGTGGDGGNGWSAEFQGW